jgi:gas vesicle protein
LFRANLKKARRTGCRAEIEVFIMIMRSGRYESSENSGIGSAVTFLLIGLGAGALVALLFAPKTGKHFRRDLKRGYEEAKDTLQEWGDEARDRAQEAKEKVLDVAERGAGWAEELRETARKAEPLRRIIKRG